MTAYVQSHKQLQFDLARLKDLSAAHRAWCGLNSSSEVCHCLTDSVLVMSFLFLLTHLLRPFSDRSWFRRPEKLETGLQGFGSTRISLVDHLILHIADMIVIRDATIRSHTVWTTLPIKADQSGPSIKADFSPQRDDREHITSIKSKIFSFFKSSWCK